MFALACQEKLSVLLPDQFRGVSAVQFAFRFTLSLLTLHWLSHSLIPVLGRCRCEHCQTKRRLYLWHPRLEDCVWLIHACHNNQTRQTANLLNHLACYPPRSDFPSLFVSLSLITLSLHRNLAETALCHPCLIVLDRCVTNGLIMSPQTPCHHLNESWVNEHP